MFEFGVVLAMVVTYVHGQDEYVAEAATTCQRQQDMFSCGKYKLLKYLDTVSSDTVLVTNSTYPVQLVRIHNPDETGTFFPESRDLNKDGELGKMMKFLQKRADRFLRTQGVSVPLPEGFRVIDDDDDEEDNAVGRGRVQKKRGMISLLTLFGVFKVKVLLALALMGIFFIKKVILLGALVLPSFLHNLKASCKHAVSHHIGHSGHGEEYHDDYYGA